MKVSDLLEVLTKCNPDLNILTDDYCSERQVIVDSITVVGIVENKAIGGFTIVEPAIGTPLAVYLYRGPGNDWPGNN